MTKITTMSQVEAAAQWKKVRVPKKFAMEMKQRPVM